MLNKLYNIKPATFFIFAAIFCEILFNIVTPPLQAPDEFNHFYRAYQITEGHFLPERTVNRLGGEIPVCINTFFKPYFIASTNLKYVLNADNIADAYNVQFTDSVTKFRDFPNTANYSAVSYLPQAFGVFLIKQFTCKVSTLYYCGRLFGFIFWLLIMYLVIRIVPVYKWLFTTLILLPMNLYVVNSFSADNVTNCLALLFMALILSYVFSERMFTKKDLVIVSLIIVFLALAKVVYIGLIVLVFLIPAHKFASRFYRFASIAAIFVISFIIVFWWSNTIMQFYIPFSKYDPDHNFFIGLSSCANYYEQKKYILEHGFYFFSVIYHSIVNHPQQFLKGYIGVFGQSDILMPSILYFFSYIFILFLAFTEINKVSINWMQRAIILVAGLSSFVLLLLSQHLMWDCIGEGVVDLVQGRYLIPIFPLLFILFNNKKFQLKYSPVVILLPFLILIYAYSANMIYSRFFVESFTSKMEFYCDAETKDENGFYLTNNSNIKLDNGITQTSEEHNTGKFSALLYPELPYGFTYKFKDLEFGDLIEIECWQKGDGGNLVVSGKGKSCGEFFFSFKDDGLILNNGWSKIHTAFTMTKNCDSTEAVFFAWNPGKNKVYFDDIKFTIKKFDNYLNN